MEYWNIEMLEYFDNELNILARTRLVMNKSFMIHYSIIPIIQYSIYFIDYQFIRKVACRNKKIEYFQAGF